MEFSYVDTTGRATEVSAMLGLPLPECTQAKWFLPRLGGYHLIWYAKPSPTKPDSLYLSALDSDFQLMWAPHLGRRLQVPHRLLHISRS